MALLSAAVAAFAHRAITERNPEILAHEALAYLAAGLEATRVELYALSADGESLELTYRFPLPRDPQPVSLPARGRSIAAAANARLGDVVREAGAAAGEPYAVATAVACDGHTCVFVAYSRAAFSESAGSGLDAIATMYAAAIGRGTAEARVADRESRLRLILDQMPAIVSTLDADLVFTSAQGAAIADLSSELLALIGRALPEIFEETSLPVVCARKVLAGTPAQFEWTWQGRTFDNRMEPLRDSRGSIAGVVNLGVDVTEARRAEAALRESREELRRLSAAMHQIQENERRRIAREIHDDLGQRLTALRLDLGLLRDELHEGRTVEADARTAAMLDLVDETLDTARRVARELRPAILDDFGFAAAIEHELASFARRTNIDTALKIEPQDVAIEPARATALYRVIQEALTNVARHSGATRVEVRIEKLEGRVEAEVRDNGRGITAEELSHPSALGLIGMRERILAFAGSVRIERLNDGGTRVRVSVPDEAISLQH